MKNTYEEEMYSFLTLEENMKGLIIARNQFAQVRERLLLDFWRKTRELLSERLTGIDDNRWEVILEDDRMNHHLAKLMIRDNQLRIQSNNCPSFLFCWERLTFSYPFYGFWINMDSLDYSGQEVKDFLVSKKNELFPSYYGADGWWPFWNRDPQIDFNIDESLLHILPGNAEKKAKEFSDVLYHLFEKMQPIYREILEKFKV